jgi:hypothetical protein
MLRRTQSEGDLMRRASIGSIVALALLIALDARSQTEKWDQAKVTALAGELANAVSGLRNSLMNSEQWQVQSQDPALWGVAEDLRMIEFEAISMNADLAKGAGMNQTLPAYMRLQQIHRELSQYQGQVDVGAFLAPPLAKAKGVLVRLAAYYPPQPKLTQ